MTANHQPPPPPAADPAVEAEWQRVEAARLAEERAEAREDAQEAVHHPPAEDVGRRWLLPAFAMALAAGVGLAILLNRPQPEPPIETIPEAVVKRAVDVWAEANRIDESNLASVAIRRVSSTAVVPADQLVIRVAIRDQPGRDRLESLLAASGLRIESDRDRLEGTAGVVPIDSLVVSGRPADVDALVDRLIASPTMLDVRSPALLAAPAVDVPTAESGPAAGAPAVSIDPGGGPGQVRVRVEVVELPAGDGVPAEPVGGTAS